MAVIARDYHTLSAHSGIYELGQMGLGLFGSDLLHRKLISPQASGTSLAQYKRVEPLFCGASQLLATERQPRDTCQYDTQHDVRDNREPQVVGRDATSERAGRVH